MFEQIFPGIYLLCTTLGTIWSGVILLQGEENILVDCGTSAVVHTEILPALSGLGLSPADISKIVVTHTHADHVGGLREMKLLSGADVIVSDRIAEKLKDPTHFGMAIRSRFPEDSPVVPLSIAPVEADIILRDGDVIANRLQMLCTPGHDDDSVVWYDLQTKTLITGDSVQLGGTAVQGMGFYMYPSAYMTSLRKLMALNAENLLAGHDSYPLGYVARGKQQTQEFLEGSLQYAERYEEAAQTCASTEPTEIRRVAELLCKEDGRTPPELLYMAMITVQAHINENICESKG